MPLEDRLIVIFTKKMSLADELKKVKLTKVKPEQQHIVTFKEIYQQKLDLEKQVSQSHHLLTYSNSLNKNSNLKKNISNSTHFTTSL